MAYRILVADDEAEIRDVLRLYLEKEGYEIVEAADGLTADRLLKTEKIDLAILDIMMPGLDGYRILRNIRESNNLPVLMLSAKSGDSDKILGLDLGADDYITKPFVPLEAVARVKSNLRRFYALGAGEKAGAGDGVLTLGDLRLEQDACLLYRKGERIELTSVEFRILKLFMEHPGKVFTKQLLFEAGWEENYMLSDNNVMVCISKLRAKLAHDGKEYITTIRGLGYRMEKE
ncbi:MAG: response regulator transcription factor [Bacteroidales bacterium]|nr:response regulator transcription factor [Bacteroidales bacterium]MCM1415257.1 response regulator transcription factor [bacterium]MCM1423281.1 response regulator transcription factor [bacterium]